mgnify:CR=1 FL=1
MSAAKPDRRALSGAARIYAVQALFQMEAADQSADRVAREFQDWRIGVDYEEGTTPEADAALFAGILDGVVDRQARIDQMTDRALVSRWPIDRIDPTLRAVFRAAGAEFVASDADAPVGCVADGAPEVGGAPCEPAALVWDAAVRVSYRAESLPM